MYQKTTMNKKLEALSVLKWWRTRWGV